MAAFLETTDGGEARQLFVGGDFIQAGDVPVANQASWNGPQWSDFDGGVQATRHVRTLYNVSTQEENSLYVGSSFTRVGDDFPAVFMARWRTCPDVIFGDRFGQF